MASNTQVGFTSECVEGVIYVVAGAGGNGDIIVANLIDVTGAGTFRSTLTVAGTGLTTLGGALTVAGLTIHNGAVSITGTNTLTVGTGLTTTAGLITNSNTTAVPSTGSSPSGSVGLSGSLAFTGSNLGNTIMFNTNGLGVPTNVTSRSIGTRMVLYPSFVNATACDFAIGVTSGALWYGTALASDAHAFYNGSILTLNITNTATTFGSNNIVTITNATPNISGSGAPSASLNLAGGLAFTGTTGLSASIMFAQGVNAEPTCGTYSTGTRLILWPNISSTTPAYSIGIGNSSMWFTVDFTGIYRWYIGNGTATPQLISDMDVFAMRLYQGTPMSNTGFTQNGALIVGGAIALTGTTSYQNCISFYPINNAEPTSTSLRSIGARLILWPNQQGTNTDYAIGVGSTSMWYQVDVSASHNFYTGITNIGIWNTSTLFVYNALSVTGFTTGPSTTNANTQLYIYEDMTQTTVSTVTLAGNATYLQSNYIQLTPASGTQVGFAYVRQDPGSSWTAQFDYYFGGGTGADGTQFFVQQTALPSFRANSGGWSLCMDEFNNLIVGMSPAQVTTASAGRTTDTLTTWLTTATWATIIVTFQQGTFRVYINNVHVPSLTFSKLPVAQPAATYMGFVGATGGSTNIHRIRNVRVEKGVGNYVPVFGTTATWNTPLGITNISNTTAATSTTTGCLTAGGGVGIAGALYIGGALNITGLATHTSTTTIATNDILLTSTDGSINLAGDLVFSNATSQMIGFIAAGTGAPVFTNRALGTKLILLPAVTASTVDHAIGVTSTALWLSASAAAHTVNMYSATTLNMQVGTTIIATFPTTTVGSSVALTASTGSLNLAGDLVLSNATSQMLGFRAAGTGAPALTARSLGTKLLLLPAISGIAVDHAIGVTSTALWLSASGALHTIDMYTANTLDMQVSAAMVTIFATTTVGSAVALTASTGSLNLAGDLVLSNATSQMIGFAAAGTGAPALTTRSLGTKLLLKPTVSGTQTDTALGVSATALWLSNGITAGTIDFYSVATLIMSLSASALTLSTGMSIVMPKTTSTATLSPTTNGSCGSITTTSLTTAAGGSATITWTNSTITTTSIILLTCFTAGTGVPLPLITAQGAGTATISLRNVSTTAAFNNTVRINFIVV